MAGECTAKILDSVLPLTQRREQIAGECRGSDDRCKQERLSEVVFVEDRQSSRNRRNGKDTGSKTLQRLPGANSWEESDPTPDPTTDLRREIEYCDECVASPHRDEWNGERESGEPRGNRDKYDHRDYPPLQAEDLDTTSHDNDPGKKDEGGAVHCTGDDALHDYVVHGELRPR